MVDTKKKNIPGIDLDFHSQYEPSLGFRVAIEAIHNNTEKTFFGVLASVLPSASVYDPGREGPLQDAFAFIQPDYDSGHQQYVFREGDAIVKNIKPDKEVGLSLFLDI